MSKRSQTNERLAERKPRSPSRNGKSPGVSGKIAIAVMTVAELMKLSAAELKKVTLHEQEAGLAYFRLGELLCLARTKCKGRNWGKLLDQYQIARTSDWEARELYSRAQTEEAIAGLSKAEALKKFKIRRPKKSLPASAATSDQPDRQDEELAEVDSEEQGQLGSGDNDDDADTSELHDSDGDLETDLQQEPNDSEFDVSVEEEVNDEQDEGEYLLVKMDEVIESLATIEASVKSTDIDHDLRPRLREQVETARLHLHRIGRAISEPVPA
jgi:hypothetical protein